MVLTMKQNIFLSLLFFLSASATGAGYISLERLEDFDPQEHTIFVNVEVETTGECQVDPVYLVETFAGLLEVFGFQTANVDESHLEFAVSVKGLRAVAEQTCGLKQLSMARQIPRIKMLRISPGSNSTRYRLWSVENIVTAPGINLQSSLTEQARRDVVAFVRIVNQ